MLSVGVFLQSNNVNRGSCSLAFAFFNKFLQVWLHFRLVRQTEDSVELMCDVGMTVKLSRNEVPYNIPSAFRKGIMLSDLLV